MKLKIRGMRTNIFGSQNSGKTTYTKEVLLPNIPNHLVYDIGDDYGDSIRGKPRFKRYVTSPTNDFQVLNKEFQDMWQHMKTKDLLKHIHAIVADEAEFLVPAGMMKRKLASGLQELNARGGSNHLDIGLVLISRHPMQIQKDFRELAHQFVLFRLTGEGITENLNKIQRGLGDAVFELGDHEFIHYIAGQRDWEHHEKLKLKRK